MLIEGTEMNSSIRAKICRAFANNDGRSTHWQRLQERRQREAGALLTQPSPGSLASVLARKKGQP
jgi:hypothetical protein